MASFVYLTEGIGEITEWTIGFGAFHVIPNMSSDKNGVRALQSTPFEALRMPLPLSVRSCVCGRRLDLFGHRQHAAGQGFSAGEDLLSKALWNRSAGKQEPEFPQT